MKIYFYKKDLAAANELKNFKRTDIVINLASLTDAEGSLKIKNKIYLERDFTTLENIPERSVSNDNEVKSYLLKKDFVPVRLGEIMFSEQVDLFNNADCIVGLHGAGFANLVFCKPGTKVIELRSPDAGYAIANLAKKNNLNYSSIITEAKHIYKYNFPTQQGHVQVPISSLNKILGN